MRMKRLYEKRNGTYVQAPEYRRTERLHNGWYVVHIQPTSKSYRYSATKITPERAKVVCALREVEDVLVSKVMEASKLRMKRPSMKLTKKQKAAWETLIKEFGPEAHYLEFASVQEIVTSALNDLEQSIDKENKK